MQIRKIPKFEELVEAAEKSTYQKDCEFFDLLNNNPPKEWIKEHPEIKIETTTKDGKKVNVPFLYIPIEKVEFLLKGIFELFNIEIIRESVVNSSVYMVVRISYFHPIYKIWCSHDGIGAVDIKGGNSRGLAGKRMNLAMAMPLAKTVALKNACSMFGNLFGANLNRDIEGVTVVKVQSANEDKLAEIMELMDKCKPLLEPQDLIYIERIINKKDTFSYDKVLKQLRLLTNE